MKPTVLDLFSGIGGFSLAFESVGFRTVAFCEIDPDASVVLNPEIENLGDIRKFDCGRVLRAHGAIDVVTGGVPCQPASALGQMRGTADERWLWPEAIRVVREIRPRYAVFENPPSILVLEGGGAWNGIVSELVALGYDLWWDVFPAAAIGAGHLRERLFIVAAHAHSERCNGEPPLLRPEQRADSETDGNGEVLFREEISRAHADLPRLEGHARDGAGSGGRTGEGRSVAAGGVPEISPVTHSNGEHGNGAGFCAGEVSQQQKTGICGGAVELPDLRGIRIDSEDWWAAQSPVQPLVDGLPGGLAEAALRCVGNAVVPQVAAIIAEAICGELVNR